MRKILIALAAIGIISLAAPLASTSAEARHGWKHHHGWSHHHGRHYGWTRGRHRGWAHSNYRRH
jgi:hypothetical protein